IRTDLHLLLECLKYQMKSPASQKQALLTIASICQQNSGQNVEFLKEIGGVTFIYNLSRASDFPEVKETALFTLSALAEASESCKQSLCRKEIFGGLADCMEQEVSLTLKRVAVYMLCVLVSNNRQGQSLAQTSKCIEILLNLFRSTYPTAEGTNELLQLWTSVSSALCGCVNNPQNEENQHACMCVLPLVKVWLLQVSVFKVELVQPVCSFISMTVANNSCVQEYFASIGGLHTLSDTLSSVVTQCRENTAACQLAILITRTMSFCITDNEALAPVLSELTLVPDFLMLLSSPILSPRDQLAVVLTLGHCTDACVEHQSQLLQGGGLPLMISLLTDVNDEEVKRAATFVLQTCRNLTGSLTGQIVESDLQRHRQSAWDIQQKIQQLERRQMVCVCVCVCVCVYQPTDCKEDLWEGSTVRKAKGQSQVCEEGLWRENIPQNLSLTKQRPTQPMVCISLKQQQLEENLMGCSETEKSEQPMRRERQIKNRGIKEIERSETRATNLNKVRSRIDLEKENLESASCTKELEKDRDVCSPNIFKCPAPMKRRQQILFRPDDELSVCSELLDHEIERILITPATSKHRKLRCAGCVSGLDEVNSRTIGVVLRTCKSQCEFHQVLQRAEDRLKRSLRIDRITHTRTHDHISDCGVRDVCSVETTSTHTMKEKQSHADRSNCRAAIRLINLTPLKRSHQTQDKLSIYSFNLKLCAFMIHRDRKNYSSDELKYLSEGVRRFGHSWNTILWAYPFQQGRTNTDLAKKYRKLHQDSVLYPELITQESA
ncbi:telomere repeats-binding bouquet formation protein 1, partial [Silurus asotus]